MNHVRHQEVSLTAQLMQLKRRHPSGTGAVCREKLVWLQRIRPTALTHEYSCRLEYKRDWYPRMYVIDPPLTTLAQGRKLPHVRTEHMEEPVIMCLYHQDIACWNPRMLLSEVVVPMAYFWLAAFEHWLFSGEWHGGGTHEIAPDPPKITPIFPSDLNLAAVA